MSFKTHLSILTLSTVLTIALPFGAFAQGAFRCENIFTDTRSFENLTKYEQLFTRGRGLDTYRAVLGKDFSKHLQKILQQEQAHWFDSGAGFGYAVRQTLNHTEAKNLKATIVAYETGAHPSEKLKVISGRFLENISDIEIPKSDLITDVFGPLAYSGRPDIVMQKYLNNLKPEGEIYIFLGARHELYGEFNRVVTAKGEVLNFAQWLESLPGLKTELIKTPKDDDGNSYEMWTIKITKVDPRAQVPTVEMIHLKEGAPPVMMFRETSQEQSRISANLVQETRARFRETYKNFTATEFLDSFRGGEIRHPLIASIKGLKREDQWVNSSEVGPRVFDGMKNKDYDFQDTSIFTSLSQKFIRWRAKGINTEKINYTPLSDSSMLKDIKDVKLITDYYGDFISSFTPDVVLNRYLQALSPKGEIYLYLGKEYGGFGTESVVMTRDGKRLPLRKWIQTIPGIKASLFRGGYHWAGGEWTFLRVKIGNTNKIQIPKLRMLGAKDSAEGMPSAVFEEVL